ncbi:MAG TPA: deoxyribose-phosphate aldolase [Bacteroidetes bacterium]|nr:deoxyribose-phosphate aldolase [Bacteroidota bacterium]
MNAVNHAKIFSRIEEDAGEIAGIIDHTLLKADATASQIKKICVEALEFRFASVCVNATYVKLAADELAGKNIPVCVTVGFPLGAHLTEVKVLETKLAIADGAQEVDMVINIGAMKNRDYNLVQKDIHSVVEVSKANNALCKVIFETAAFTDEEIITLCALAKNAHADFVKTSTGFGAGGATTKAVALMLQEVGGSGLGVKAAGGIRNFADAFKMAAAGASRIGTSSGVAIVREALAESED